jgi:hypothetical protein
LHYSYCAGDKIKKNELGGACSAYGEGTGVYRVLVGKPEVREHLVNPGVDGRIMLDGSSGSKMWGYGLD